MPAQDLDEAQLLRLEERLDECWAALGEALTSSGFAQPFVLTTVGDVQNHIAARVAAAVHRQCNVADVAGDQPPRRGGRRRA